MQILHNTNIISLKLRVSTSQKNKQTNEVGGVEVLRNNEMALKKIGIIQAEEASSGSLWH